MNENLIEIFNIKDVFNIVEKLIRNEEIGDVVCKNENAEIVISKLLEVV